MKCNWQSLSVKLLASACRAARSCSARNVPPTAGAVRKPWHALPARPFPATTLALRKSCLGTESPEGFLQNAHLQPRWMLKSSMRPLARRNASGFRPAPAGCSWKAQPALGHGQSRIRYLHHEAGAGGSTCGCDSLGFWQIAEFVF